VHSHQKQKQDGADDKSIVSQAQIKVKRQSNDYKFKPPQA